MRAGGLMRRRAGGGGGGGGLTFLGQTSWARPAFTPSRTVSFTTKTGLDSAISGMQPGDLIQYTGTGVYTISNSSSNGYALNNKNPAGAVTIDFGCSHNIWDPSKVTSNYVHIVCPQAAQYHTFLVNACSNLRIYGGDIDGGNSTSYGSGGLAIMGNTHDCYVWDMYGHDFGNAGGNAFPHDAFSGAEGTINNVSVRYEATNWGMNPSIDTHTAAPGTGLHAINTADGIGHLSNNTFAIWGHNPTTVGSCLEIGSEQSSSVTSITNNVIYVKADTFHFHSTQAASNALNVWGSISMATNVFAWIEGNDLYGSVMGGSFQSGTVTGMVVQHGRHFQTNLNPSDGQTVPYAQGKGIVYQDCQ